MLGFGHVVEIELPVLEDKLVLEHSMVVEVTVFETTFLFELAMPEDCDVLEL